MFGITGPLGNTSLLVILVTFILFVLALFSQGLTHDILLEAAVFLVSVKLIVMAYRDAKATDSLHKKLDTIMQAIHLECSPEPKQ
jgi:hypothetical protein